jgi:hypothetical protein
MAVQIEHPVLPYPEPDGTATTGWAGSDASHERARREAADGTSRDRQDKTLRLVSRSARHGLTVAELREATGWHHGQASSVLSTLHKEGFIARLQEKRERCHIYMLPVYVSGPTDDHGRTRRLTYEEGYVEGVKDQKRKDQERLLAIVEEMQAAILKLRGPIPHSPSNTAWAVNPVQTLDAVKKHIRQM